MKKAQQVLLFFGFIFLLVFLTSCHHVQNIDNSQTGSNISKAYSNQFAWVNKQSKSIIGYKAGLTSQAGQSKFKISEPVAGALFNEGLSHSRQVYLIDAHTKLMLETEIGFIIKHDINHLIAKPHQLNKIIDKVVPVIELPDLAYPDLSTLTGDHLIATNVASNKVLIGAGKPLSDLKLNSITTQLTKNGAVVIKGKATDAMGDQMLALQWLINRVIKSGYKIKQGDLLITGALGQMVAAEKGNYDADFGALGHLAFSVR